MTSGKLLHQGTDFRFSQAEDYDAQLGQLVFSRGADATVRYDAWQLERVQGLLFLY